MSAPKERAVRLTATEVRAVLSGAKTQMREIVKPQPPEIDENGARLTGFAPTTLTCTSGFDARYELSNPRFYACPYAPGQRLWVQETFAKPLSGIYDGKNSIIRYRAGWRGLGNPSPIDLYGGDYGARWRPSVHMPRWASRITLEVTRAWPERLQLLSESDVQAEGFNSREDFAMFFSPERWNANPWMWCVEFRRLA